MHDKLEWWRENRLGMFVHWGLYSATEGYWNGKETQGICEWIQCREKIPLRDYMPLAEKMTLEDFDADEWVALAKRAGMGHIVVTAKHHEGFAMYDSACCDYNIVARGPSGRDPLKELSEACARGGIRFCVYYSHAIDFHHPDGKKNDWDFDPNEKCFERYLEEKCKPQLRELLTNYGPVGLIWFDMPTGITHEQTLELKELVQELQPDCIPAARLGNQLEEYGSLGDNELPCGPTPGNWETPATLNDTWGYKRDDQNWKTVPELVESLVELAACGVNYLVNVGPTGSGKIPEASVRLLEGLGEWMETHRESIIGTSRSPFPAHGDNWLATSRDKTLYLFPRQWPRSLSIRGLRSTVQRADVLGAPEETVEVAQKGDRLFLSLPELPATACLSVIRLVLDSAPQCTDLPTEQPDDCIYLPGCRAEVSPGREKPDADGGSGIETELAVAAHELECFPNGVIGNWRRTDDRLTWQFRTAGPGTFDVLVRTQGRKYGEWEGGQRLHASIDGRAVESILDGTEPVDKPRTRYFPEHGSVLGTLEINGPAPQCLSLSADTFIEGADLKLTEIVLRRVSLNLEQRRASAAFH